MKDNEKIILETLLQKELLTAEQQQQVLHYQKAHEVRLEDALVETGVIEEEMMLKQLAQLHRTRFVATEKLKRADISPSVIEKIPFKIASKYGVCPILYNGKENELSVITSNPSDITLEQVISSASGVPRLRLFVARPAAVGAAISKFYKGDIHAFASLDKAGFEAYHQMLDVYERNLIDADSMATSLVDTHQREQVFSADDINLKAKRAEKGGKVGGELSTSLEILRIMVALLESNRSDLAGHSVQTATLMRQMCVKIKLSSREQDACEMAGLLHDLGKGSPYHLTALNVAEWEGHRTTAQKRFKNPEQLFSSVVLPETTIMALLHMYERFDGQGLPKQMRGMDIPLGARILAIADTYADLTSNPRNPYRKILSTEKAITVLKKAKERVFDPNLVDIFASVVVGHDLKCQLLTGAQSVLLIDPDPEQSAILDLQLTSRGFRVRCATSPANAYKMILNEKPNIIVSEVVFDKEDGFALKKKLNEEEDTRIIPFVYLTSQAGDVEKGFAFGAQDYLVKPTAVDVVSAKIHKLLEDKLGESGGVSGSLTEMSLPDLVQILSQSRKSGQLKLKMGQHRGEIHFVDGAVYNALFDNMRGEEAFFQMLRHRDGGFSLNPSFVAEAQVIQMTPEMLLLEGMRRFDEDTR